MSGEPNVPKAPTPPSSFKLVATLAGIAIGSGLLVSSTYQITLEPIRKNRIAALEKAVFSVLPEATVTQNFKLDESGLHALANDAISETNVFAGYNDDGELTGVALEGSSRGYQDIVKILYGYSPEEQVITGFTVLQSAETPGLGDRVETDPDFLANFGQLDARLNADGTALANPIITVKNGTKTEPWQIDAISGATVTSAAIGRALNDSGAAMLPLLQKHKSKLFDKPAVERNGE